MVRADVAWLQLKSRQKRPVLPVRPYLAQRREPLCLLTLQRQVADTLSCGYGREIKPLDMMIFIFSSTTTVVSLNRKYKGGREKNHLKTIERKRMTIEELEAWQEAFEQFHARFADLFERSESREQSKKYLRGLLAQAERKNSWQVAEVVGDRIPDRMQRLLYRVPWDADAVRDRLQQFVSETFGDEEGIGVVDETGFLKKGKKSVGVGRQYTGTAGKRENSQVATVLRSEEHTS